MADNRVVIGVFAERVQAEQAMNELQHAGFRTDHMGLCDRQQPFKRTILIVQADEHPLDAFHILAHQQAGQISLSASA